MFQQHRFWMWGIAEGQAQLRSIRDRFGIAGLLLGFGLFWSVAGVMLTPTLKFYDRLLIVFVYLPCLYLVIRQFQSFREAVLARKELWLFFLIFAWSLGSLAWSIGVDRYLTLIKRELFFLLVLLGWIVWGRVFRRQLQTMLIMFGALAGLYSLAALIAYPFREIDRMYGFGGFMDNPNPSGYTIAFLVVLSCSWWPRHNGARVVWALLQACSIAFVVLTGSRGAMLALAVVAGSIVLVGGGRFYRAIALSILMSVVALLMINPSLLQRGDSERLSLIRGAWDLVQQHPWRGIGFGSDYEVTAGEQAFGHCHNFVLDTAVQYGVVFTAVWLFLWFWLGFHLWRCRVETLGMSILMVWVFATVSIQFDVFILFGGARAMWMVVWIPFVLALCTDKSQTPGITPSS
nr:O-antigen ligase family protein [Pseudomonas akapageensis]